MSGRLADITHDDRASCVASFEIADGFGKLDDTNRPFTVHFLSPLLHEEVCEMVHHWTEAIAGTKMARVKCMRQDDPYSAYAISQPHGRHRSQLS